MELDWYPATVSKRGKIYYIVMTVPKQVRALLGGGSQRRLSTGTSDLEIAKRKRHDLEAELRKGILADLEKARLCDPSGSFQRAVSLLGLRDAAYSVDYDAELDDVLETTFREPPTSKVLLEKAEKVLRGRLSQVRAYRSDADLEQAIKILEDFDLEVPLLEDAEAAVAAALTEARRANGVEQSRLPISALLPWVEADCERQVEQGALKRKTAKQRARHVRQFIDFVGDIALDDLEPKHAYAYAEALGDEMGNSTIKTRVSDVRVALRLGVEKGLIKFNPFENLNLSRFGVGTKSHDPLSDEQIQALVDQPGLPEHVRNIWLILACTGMRLDEVATLRVDQVKREGVNGGAKTGHGAAQKQATFLRA